MSNTKYTGRETKEGTWRVFKSGQSVAVAGPFKSAEEARAWITSAEEDKKKQGVQEAGLKLNKKINESADSYKFLVKPGRRPLVIYYDRFDIENISKQLHPSGERLFLKGRLEKVINDGEVQGYKFFIDKNSGRTLTIYYNRFDIENISKQLHPSGERLTITGILEEVPEHIHELSPQTLASYKKKAGAAASEADKLGEFEKGHQRFKGIMKATKKEFEQDRKNVRENAESTADKKTDAKIAALEKKIKDTQDAIGLARERRRMKGQRQQGSREMSLQKKINGLQQQMHMLQVGKKTAVNEDREYYAAERALANAKIAKENGDMGDYYTLMAEYHDNMMQWNQSKGRYNAADRDAEKVKQYTDAAQKHDLYSNMNEDGLIGNPTDRVTMDVPLMIRIMEYAREDAKTDMDLHNVAEQLIKLSASGKTLSMQDYDSIVAQQTENKIFELGAIGSAIGSATLGKTATSTSPTTQPTQANARPTSSTTSTTSSPTTTQPATSPTTTAAKPAPANLKPDEQDALNKIMSNAGLKTQFQQLVQKAKTVPGA